MSDPDNLVSDELYDIFVDSIYGTGDDGRSEFQEGRLRCALERFALAIQVPDTEKQEIREFIHAAISEPVVSEMINEVMKWIGKEKIAVLFEALSEEYRKWVRPENLTSGLYPPLPPGIAAEIIPTIKIGCSRYQHIKTGGFYEVIGPGKLEWDLADVIVYRSEHDGSLWVRPKSEFYDGRFVRVPPRMPPSKDD